MPTSSSPASPRASWVARHDADAIARTRVLETWLQGEGDYRASATGGEP